MPGYDGNGPLGRRVGRGLGPCGQGLGRGGRGLGQGLGRGQGRGRGWIADPVQNDQTEQRIKALEDEITKLKEGK